MLVLSRKPGDQIRIGDKIMLKILGVSGDKVRVGIVAPQEVHVVRGELEADQHRAARERDAA